MVQKNSNAINNLVKLLNENISAQLNTDSNQPAAKNSDSDKSATNSNADAKS